MAFGPRTKLYPASGRVRFNGGLNNKYHREIIAENESPDCANVRFSDDAVETRGGSTRLNTAAVGSFACDGLYTRHDNTGAESLVAWFGGTAYVYAAPSFATIGSAQSIYTAGQRVAGAEYEGYLFMCNGGSIAYKYGSSAFTRHGVYAPQSAPVAATAATGAALTGSYSYKVTYVNSAAVEGDVSTVSNTLTVAGQNVTVTIPTAPASWGVNSRRLYRVSGAVYSLIATISDNTTTTYDDAISAGTTSAPTDNGVPPKYNSIVYAKGRLFCNDTANPNYVWWSEADSPYTFASTSFRLVGDNTQDVVRGLAVYNDNVVVLCEKSIYILYIADSTPSNWQLIKTKSAYGCRSQFATFNYNNSLMFPAMQGDKFVGFAALTGDSIEPEVSLLTTSAALSELKSDPIEPDVFLISDTSLIRSMYAAVYKNLAYISVPYGTTPSANNRIYVYDFSLRSGTKGAPAWSPDTGITANQFTIFGGSLYFGSATANGRVYQYETATYNDDGAAIDSYYWTKEFSGDKAEQNLIKDWRFANILYELSGNYYMEMRYRTDSDLGVGNQKLIDLTPGGSLWGSFNWGDVWTAGRQEKDIRQSFGQLRGKRVQLKFSNLNTLNQKFKVIGLNLLYNSKGLR